MTATGLTVQERLNDRISAALVEAESDPRTQAAIDELRGLIRTAYPTADFSIEHGVEPPALYLIATIDEDDIDDARDVYIDRLVGMQVDEGLPLFVHVQQPRPWALAARRQDESVAGVREPVAHG